MHKALGKGRGKELIYVTKEVMGNYKYNRQTLPEYCPFLG
jgi:hypothetical protein